MKNTFHIGKNALGYAQICFRGNSGDSGFPKLVPLLRSYLGATSVDKLAHLNIHDVTMEYPGGRFSVQSDNWFTGIVVKENADKVVPEIAAALIKSSLFEQTDPPQSLVS